MIKCRDYYGGEAVPLAVVSLLFDSVGPGTDSFVFLSPSGVLLRVKEAVSVSSGIVANFFSTCLSAGRRIGLLLDISSATRDQMCASQTLRSDPFRIRSIL